MAWCWVFVLPLRSDSLYKGTCYLDRGFLLCTIRVRGADIPVLDAILVDMTSCFGGIGRWAELLCASGVWVREWCCVTVEICPPPTPVFFAIIQVLNDVLT